MFKYLACFGVVLFTAPAFAQCAAPIDRSFTTTNTGAVTIAPRNTARRTLNFFNIPSGLTSGLYISGTATAANATSGSANIPASTVLYSFPSSVIGVGAITAYTTIAGQVINVWEC